MDFDPKTKISSCTQQVLVFIMLTFLQNCEINYFLQKEKAYLAVRGWGNVKYHSIEMMVPRGKRGAFTAPAHV